MYAVSPVDGRPDAEITTLAAARTELAGLAAKGDSAEQGTVAAAKHAAKLAREGKLVAVAGGGDTVAALNAAGVTDDFTFVSTAGGAFLEWMEGKTLPGVAALQN